MTQDNLLSSNDLRSQADQHNATVERLSKKLPVLINRYQELVNMNASLDEILVSKKDIDDLASSIAENTRIALELTLKAVTSELMETDVNRARQAIDCSTGKLKLALDKLEDTRNALIVVAGFIRISGALLATASATGVASIKNVIDEFDNLVSIQLKKSLSAEDLERIKKMLSEKCSQT
jgi:hypothetical protein